MGDAAGEACSVGARLLPGRPGEAGTRNARPGNAGWRWGIALAVGGATFALSSLASAYDCKSSDPQQWPPASKPYFMLAVDTSGSMNDSVGTASSCGWGSNKNAHARCAINKTVKAFSEVNYGLATYARKMANCSATCFSGCTFSNFTGNTTSNGCGPEPTNQTNSADRHGGNVVVEFQQDNYWSSPPTVSNVPEILKWVDNNCADSKEIFHDGSTPLNGILRDMYRYFSVQWVSPDGSPTYLTPLTDTERPCRSVNVILVTDGDETCDSDPADPVDAAADLLTGFDVTTPAGTPLHWSVKTYVIGIGQVAAANQIAAAGGTGAAYDGSNETLLSKALATIIGNALKPEVCNNGDDNCNSCIDEGYQHFCNLNPTCCSWSTTTQRNTCITNYQASITSTSPQGTQSLLPCTTVAQQSDDTTGLCYDPGDVCDNIDDNCNGTTDEKQLKCGSPLHCPTAETCNGLDDNCDGVIDNTTGSGVPYSVCPGGCQTSPEICDGCDNDCDGIIDNGAPSITCGYTTPSWCSGTRACQSSTASSIGACLKKADGSLLGGTYGTCGGPNYSPQPEVCDNVDNDCDGIADNNITQVGTACTPPGYSTTYPECKPGAYQCLSGTMSCVGYTVTSAEVCDGLDNDCNGIVDDNPTGVGGACGSAQGTCTQGTYTCTGGTIVCSGGKQPQPETCDGVDNNCNGLIDDSLTDAPASGQNGCWTGSWTGTLSCSFKNLTWTAPTGATCNGLGTLTTPCAPGTLICTGGAWACVGVQGPAAEVCDGQDNNCDGVMDNIAGAGSACTAAQLPTGYSTAGGCSAGSQQCLGSTLVCTNLTTTTPETCNKLDDNCDGLIDNNVPGVGDTCTPPGYVAGSPECPAGKWVCDSNGTMVCSGVATRTAEVCDGKDNDCNGATDDGALTDAPASPGCWNISGTQCKQGTLTWNPPPGGSCSGLGTLTSPCSPGTLYCDPTAGAWKCQGGVVPQTETCNLADDNCDGQVDNGVASAGAACGPNGYVSTYPECPAGSMQCQNGQMVCAGYAQTSSELCDGKDNNCNGSRDDGTLPNVGNACGSGVGQCQKGTLACVSGALVCNGGQASPEVCDGIDNDCNGFVDDNVTVGAPTDTRCWAEPVVGSADCTDPTTGATWDLPPGATDCRALGSLVSPCKVGTLTCVKGSSSTAPTASWTCVGGTLPRAEVCDGFDNDCDTAIDETGPPPGGIDGTTNPANGAQTLGATCGSDVGQCAVGAWLCVGGVFQCSGTGPTAEICNGLDDDCDGVNDNGIPLGQACVDLSYDRTLYPGPDRTALPCQPGHWACDATAGKLVCTGGKGPDPEVCDGIDNDCDGQIDEPGAAPDGINGSANPADPTQKLGDQCGSNVGVCQFGTLACENGRAVCNGGVGPQPEACDCQDNDCDGKTDEVADPTKNDPPLCQTGTSCVNFNGVCQCAGPCGGGEFPCPTTTQCQSLPDSTGTVGQYCVADPCGDCSTQTVTGAKGSVECAPGGVAPDGTKVPVCVCKSLDGCHGPCFGMQCGTGKACVPSGDYAGTCQSLDNCFFFGCATGLVCSSGSCVDNPCLKPDGTSACGATEVCKPTQGFTATSCVGSCADLTSPCASGSSCIDGACTASPCNPACGANEYCLEANGSYSCGPSRCMTTTGAPMCTQGYYCDPLTGRCGSNPCEGVVCPSGQTCTDGECWKAQVNLPADAGAGGAGGAGGRADASTPDAGTGAQAGGGSTAKELPRNWGLATGGGGCACEVGSAAPAGRAPGGAILTALGLSAMLGRRRRSRRAGSTRGAR